MYIVVHPLICVNDFVQVNASRMPSCTCDIAKMLALDIKFSGISPGLRMSFFEVSIY